MNQDRKTIQIAFEDDMETDRIAEFIDLLSVIYGEDLDVVAI